MDFTSLPSILLGTRKWFGTYLTLRSVLLKSYLFRYYVHRVESETTFGFLKNIPQQPTDSSDYIYAWHIFWGVKDSSVDTFETCVL